MNYSHEYANTLAYAAYSRQLGELKDANLVGLYKQYVIAYTSGQKFYLIIDKSTGIIKSKILAPISNRPKFDFIGNYILVNENAIYK